MSYSLDMKSSFKDLKRLIALFTSGRVNFEPEALENITLAVGVSGSKKLLKVSRFALQNRDIDLNAETTVQFSPLNIQASVKSEHLRVDSFIPLPVKQNTAKDSLSVKTKKIPPEEDAAVKDVSGVADTSDAAVKSPPLYTLDKQGNIVLSRLPLAELLTIPDMSVRADIDMTGIRYRRHESMRFSSLIRVEPKTQIVAEIVAGYKKYADVSVKMDARRDDKAVKLNTDILADVSLSKEMGEDIPAEGKISLKTSLNSEGDTLIEFWDKLKLNTDINLIGIRYQGDPLPEPVMLDGRAQIKMADKIFTAQLSGLNIRNTKPDVDAEALRASVGNMKMSVSLDQILNREVDIRELVVQDTNIRLYQNRQGCPRIISSVPDANNASVDKGATQDTPSVNSAADKKPAQSGARSEPPLKKISLNVLKITNTRFAFADLSADTDISADTAEISVALPQVNLFADGLSADSFNFVLKQVRMGRQLKKQSDVAFSNDEVALNTSNLRLNYAPFIVWLGELKVDIRQVKADMVSSGQLLAVPSLGILLQGMNADMQRQAAYIKLFSLDLPQLNAETKTQTLSAENFNVKLDALAVEEFTDINKIRAKSEQFIIQNQTLTAKTKADGRRSIIRDAQIDIRIPEGLEKVYPSVSFYAEDYDATADSPRYAVYGHIGGILGALPADNYYYTDLTVGGSVFAAGINEFAEPFAGRISTAFDGKKSHIIIPELSFVLGSLARLDSNADILFAGGILNSAGKFVINSPDLRPLLKSQVGTPEHKIPLDVALDFNSRLTDNNRTHLTVKSSILTVGTAVSGLDLSANMSQNYTDIKGTLDVHTSGVRSLLNNLPVKPLNTADSRVIDRMLISSVFNYKNNTATLEKLRAEADDIRLNADGYHNLDTGKSVINISVANIDIDRYLPPVKEEQPEEKPAEIKERKPAEYPKTPLLTDELKRLITEQDVSVNISLRDLKVKNIRTEQIKLRTVAKEGIIRVMPLEIINGDGRLELTAFADVNREMYNTELTGKDFQLGDIINPLVKKDFFSGKFNSRIALKTSGNSVHNMVSGSNGVIDITMTEGQLRGFNIDYYTCVGLSAISFEIPDKEKFPADTAFTYTNIQGYVRNGNVKLYDVFSDLTTIQMAAKGEAELIAQTFKADSYVSIIEAKENYCEVQDAIKQYTLKISCDGKMYDPGIDTCAPDYNALGSLVYKGVAGKTDQLLRHYQKQVETVTSTVSAPLKVLRDFFVRFFRKIGGIFSGDNKPSPESSPPSEVINLYFRREDIISSALPLLPAKLSVRGMKAMIFAAGFGTRMKPLTLRTPKALLPYKGIPVIRHIISLLPPVKELAVNTHYLHDRVADWFAQNEFSFPVRLYYEPEILGTGGGLHNASPSLRGSDFIVWNCDILCDLNIPQLSAGFGHDVPDVI
ncbi:hypothetical protein CHS0354_006823 [Potamilus streckersoni]|uniref:Uncharacterized protein n=1 Tax=Potamilus streckersoni TaxID=2493646 RepID=A0AAE0TE91_9BIVA|nr:hypothetical protein CHS0354_006823 [Potamilus streckersoni]